MQNHFKQRFNGILRQNILIDKGQEKSKILFIWQWRNALYNALLVWGNKRDILAKSRGIKALLVETDTKDYMKMMCLQNGKKGEKITACVVETMSVGFRKK